MAFQIVDDVLDLTASEEVLGKPVASDLREGKATLAVLHALERCTPAERATIESVLGNGGFNGITPADIVAILKRYGSIDAAYARATEFSNAAREVHLHLPRLRDQARTALGSGVRGGAAELTPDPQPRILFTIPDLHSPSWLHPRKSRSSFSSLT